MGRKRHTPLLDQHGRLRQRVEDLPVQQLVPELAVEALVVSVLPRAARLDKEHLDAHAVRDPNGRAYNRTAFLSECRILVLHLRFAGTD